MVHFFAGLTIGAGLGLAFAAWVHTQAAHLLSLAKTEGKSLLGKVSGEVKSVETAMTTEVTKVEKKV